MTLYLSWIKLGINVYITPDVLRLSSCKSLVWLPVQDTFGRAKTWVSELQRQASPNIVIALAGNKADLSANRTVEYEV